MFIRSKRGLVNLRHATEVVRRGEYSIAVMVDGSTVELLNEITEIEIRVEVDSVVAAQAGYEALVFHGEFDADVSETWVQREPVLAWSVSGMVATAVTIDPDINTHTVKRPDGTISDPYDRDWDSEQAWLEDMRKRHDETRMRRKAMRDAKE